MPTRNTHSERVEFWGSMLRLAIIIGVLALVLWAAHSAWGQALTAFDQIGDTK